MKKIAFMLLLCPLFILASDDNKSNFSVVKSPILNPKLSITDSPNLTNNCISSNPKTRSRYVKEGYIIVPEPDDEYITNLQIAIEIFEKSPIFHKKDNRILAQFQATFKNCKNTRSDSDSDSDADTNSDIATNAGSPLVSTSKINTQSNSKSRLESESADAFIYPENIKYSIYNGYTFTPIITSVHFDKKIESYVTVHCIISKDSQNIKRVMKFTLDYGCPLLLKHPFIKRQRIRVLLLDIEKEKKKKREEAEKKQIKVTTK